MQKRKRGISFWYFVTFLAVITSALWFFVEFRSSKDSQEIPETAQRLTKPINGTFNKSVLDNLKQRTDIPDVDLEQAKPYARNNSVDSLDSKSQKTGVTSDSSSSDSDEESETINTNYGRGT